MSSLLIIGAGGHGRVVGEIAQICGYKVAFLDDRGGDGVVGRIDDVEKFKGRYDEFFIGIGSNTTRRALTVRIEKLCLKIAILIHPTAYVSQTAKIGVGAVVEPKALVNANSVVGAGSIISVGSIVDHDVVIEDFVHVNAGAICKAGSRIESCRKIEAGEVVHGYN